MKTSSPGMAAARIAILVAGLLACAPRADRCWVCEREIHAQVRATLTLANGREVQACCPRCALHYQNEPASQVRGIRVSDYVTGRPLPFDHAFILEGSDETPCLRHHLVTDETRAPMHVCYDRCMPSLIAFADEAAARAFMADHGGTLRPPGALSRPSPDSR